MKYTIPALLVLLMITACGKHKKYCWSCQFAATNNTPVSDTVVCDMTRSESKDFQAQYVLMLKEEHGYKDGTEITSACFLLPGRQ